MNQGTLDLLARRRDRTIAILLRAKENDCDLYLPADVSMRLRKVILDQVNEYHELACDLIKSLDRGDVVVNELWLQKVNEIHEAVVGSDNGQVQ